MRMEILPLLLAHTRVDCNGWEFAFTQELVEFGGSDCALDENDDLVELELIKQLIEFSVLLLFVQLDVVLLKTVKCELGLVVDIDLEGILHELLAYGSDFCRESGAEHHDLLLGWGSAEDFLDITAHV